MENKLLELTLARRSVRKYTGEAIDRAILDEIMKIALTAPCSFGHRPVEFVVVEDKDEIERIGKCKVRGGKQINGAGAVIVVMVHKERGEFWIEDGAIASAYILLAVEQYGLGACWVHIRNRMGENGTSDEEIRSILGVPDDYEVLNLIAIGGKAEEKNGYTMADFDKNKIHYGKF